MKAFITGSLALDRIEVDKGNRVVRVFLGSEGRILEYIEFSPEEYTMLLSHLTEDSVLVQVNDLLLKK